MLGVLFFETPPAPGSANPACDVAGCVVGQGSRCLISRLTMPPQAAPGFASKPARMGGVQLRGNFQYR